MQTLPFTANHLTDSALTPWMFLNYMASQNFSSAFFCILYFGLFV